MVMPFDAQRDAICGGQEGEVRVRSSPHLLGQKNAVGETGDLIVRGATF